MGSEANTVENRPAEALGSRDELKTVTRGQAMGFLEEACRNWRKMPPLSVSDLDDVAGALSTFLKGAAS